MSLTKIDNNNNNNNNIATFLGHTTFYTDYLPVDLIDGGVKIG